MKFYVWKTARWWFWHLRAKNGEIVCQSEGYKRKGAALKAVKLVQQSACAEVVVLKKAP